MKVLYHRSQYLEERETMMQAWADFLDAQRSGPAQVLLPFVGDKMDDLAAAREASAAVAAAGGEGSRPARPRRPRRAAGRDLSGGGTEISAENADNHGQRGEQVSRRSCPSRFSIRRPVQQCGHLKTGSAEFGFAIGGSGDR